MKNVGFSHGYPEESSAVIELRGRAEVEEALLRFAGAECGQGTSTAIQQMAADALGLPLEKVRLLPADTHLAPEAGSASASRLTLMGGQAILGAAQAALAAWRNEDRPAVGAYTYHAPPTTDLDPATGHSTPNIAFGPVAQAVEIEVDLETGELRVPRVVSVVDAGKAINPTLVEGQTQGAVAQALGYAVLENFVAENGITLTPHLSTYLLPTVLDVPGEVQTIILETPDPIGPWGARGMAEMPFLAVAPALASALKDATGVWIDRLPITPSTLLARLRGEH